MTHETRSRLGCPLCRCPWPEEDQVPLSEIIAQLRLCRTRKVAKLAVKLETAFQQARRRRYKKCFAWYKSSWCKGCLYDRICIFMFRTIYSRDTHTHTETYVQCYNKLQKASLPGAGETSFWWTTRSVTLSHGICFLALGKKPSFGLQFFEPSTHGLSQRRTDLVISGCPTCHKHVSGLCTLAAVSVAPFAASVFVFVMSLQTPD